MTLATIMRDDWAYFDDTETVKLSHTNTAGTTVNTAGVTALSFKLDTLPDGTFVTNHKLWVLKASMLGSNTPIQGDQIIDADSVAYVIEACDLRATDTTWNCITKKAVS